MKAKIRGTEIFYDIAGMKLQPKGNKLIEKPILFLIHGGPGATHIRFKYDLIELQEIAQLVFIDQRGCGWSKKTKKSDYTLENNIEDIEALRKHLGLKKICVLGASYGGMVAQGYAIRYGKHVDKLILSVTAPSFRFLEEAKKNVLSYGTKKQISVCEKYLWNGTFKNNRDVEEYFTTMDPLYSYTRKKRRKISTDEVEGGKLDCLLSFEVLNAGFGSFLQTFDFVPRLKRIKCPTLILAGQNDWICSANQSRIIAKHISNSILKVFKKCGHAIATDAGKKYLNAIRDFLKK